jgi:hypothetical protein
MSDKPKISGRAIITINGEEIARVDNVTYDGPVSKASDGRPAFEVWGSWDKARVKTIKINGVIVGSTGVEPRINGRGWVAYSNGKLLPGWFKSRKTAKAALKKAGGKP